MIDKELSELKNDIPEYNIDEYKNEIYNKYNNKKTRDYRFPKLTFATILIVAMLLGIIGLGTYSIKVEAKEYNTAVEFFEINQLSTEGLTRTEVKEIYYDIITNKFEYKKTGEVIVKSIKSKVPGYSIDLKNVDASTVASFWELWDNILKQSKPSDIEISCYDYEDISNPGSYTYKKSKVTKYENTIKCWETELYYFANGYIKSNDYIIVYGTHLNDDEYIRTAYITKINNDGKIIWEQKFEDSSKFFKIFINKDDTITAFANKSYQNTYLKMYKVNHDGEIIYNYQNSFNDLDGNRVNEITETTDGYLVHLINREYNAKFVKINKDGILQQEFSYEFSTSCEAENYKYFFTNMIEFEGKLYLSGYSVPSSSNGSSGVEKIIDQLMQMDYGEVTDELVLSLFKQNFKAVLLVCDNEDGELSKFYSVDAGVGSNLRIEDDKLVWEVEYFITMGYLPFTSSFTFGGVTQVYNYIFDKDGKFLNASETEINRMFRR